eukprot:366228-Chlamydomonas_euryale.AAC.26
MVSRGRVWPGCVDAAHAVRAPSPDSWQATASALRATASTPHIASVICGQHVGNFTGRQYQDWEVDTLTSALGSRQTQSLCQLCDYRHHRHPRQHRAIGRSHQCCRLSVQKGCKADRPQNARTQLNATAGPRTSHIPYPTNRTPTLPTAPAPAAPQLLPVRQHAALATHPPDPAAATPLRSVRVRPLLPAPRAAAQSAPAALPHSRAHSAPPLPQPPPPPGAHATAAPPLLPPSQAAAAAHAAVPRSALALHPRPQRPQRPLPSHGAHALPPAPPRVTALPGVPAARPTLPGHPRPGRAARRARQTRPQPAPALQRPPTAAQTQTPAALPLPQAVPQASPAVGRPEPAARRRTTAAQTGAAWQKTPVTEAQIWTPAEKTRPP